jgi:serine/threonine transporter
VAPLLVFVLVMSAIIGHKQGQKTNMKPILLLYVLGTFLAAAVAVASFLFPSNLHLVAGATEITPPGASRKCCRPCCSTW